MYSLKLDLTASQFTALRRAVVEAVVAGRHAGLPDETAAKVWEQIETYGGACTLKLNLRHDERDYLRDLLNDTGTRPGRHDGRLLQQVAWQIDSYCRHPLPDPADQLSCVVWSRPVA